MLHIYHQLKYSSPNRSKKEKATQKSLSFRKLKFREKEIRRMGQKQKRIRQKEQENKRGEKEKWDQTEIPEIPDRGGT